MIRVTDEDALRVITLDRADKRNALTPEMLAGLTDALRTGEGTRAVLLRGAGRVFCAGFDLTLCRDDGPDQPTLRSLLEGLSECVTALRACEAPVIVAAHGAAIAGGCALLAGADVVVSDGDARLGYPVTILGVSPAVNAAFLALAVGDGAARRALLLPELFSGAEGHRLGLVHELVVSREDVEEHARVIAESIAAKPGAGTGATKAWLNELEDGRDAGSGAGLHASLSLVGGDESRALLKKAWTK
ncbi:MAG: enoyl-CoA hydratase/isomerase family protein [Phycisphaerales bacterium JB040]